MARRGFKIGNAYIEIYGDVNEKQIRSESKEAGKEAADAQGKEYERLIKEMHEQAAKAAARSYAREAAKQQALYEGAERKNALAGIIAREKVESAARARREAVTQESATRLAEREMLIVMRAADRRTANEERIATARQISLERIAIRAQERQMRLVENASGRGGGRAGDFFGRSFYYQSNRWIRRFKRSLETAIPAGFIQSLGTMTLMQGGMLALAAAAGLAAISIGHASGSLAAMIPIAIGVKTAMFILKESFDDLAKTKMGKEFKADLKEIDDIVNRNIRPGWDALFDAWKKNFPIILDYMDSIAAILASGMTEVAELIKTKDFQERLEVILKASEETVEQLSLIADDLLDAFTTIGAAASPIAQDFMQWINEIVTRFSNWIDAMYRTGKLQDFFKKAAEEAKKWGRIIENVVRGLWAIFQNVIPYADDFSTSIENLSKKFRDWAQDERTQKKIKDFLNFLSKLDLKDIAALAAAMVAFGAAVKAIPAVAGIVQGILALFALGPVGLVLAAIALGLGLMAGALTLVFTKSEEFREKVGELWNRISTLLLPAIKELWRWFEEKIIPVLGEAAATVIDSLIMWIDMLTATYQENKYWLDPLFNIIKEVVEFLLPGFIRVVAGLHIILQALIFGPIVLAINFIGSLFTAIETVIDAGKRWWESIKQGAKDFQDKFNKALMDAVVWIVEFKNKAVAKFQEFVTWVKGLPKRIYDGLIDIKNQLAKRAREGFEEFKKAAQQKWTEISGWFQSLPGRIRTAIGDAISALRQKGRDFISGAQNGITARWNDVRTWFNGLDDKIRSAIGNAAGALKTKGREFLNGMWDGISARWKEIRTWFSEIDEKIKGAIGNLGSTLKGAGRAVLQGFLNGVKEKFEEIKDVVRNIGPWIASHKGPLTYDLKLLVPNGQAIMAGLMHGIEGQIPVFERLLSDVTGGIQATPTTGPTTTGQVLGRAGGGGMVINLGAGAVQINASDLAEMKDVRDFFAKIEQVARARGVV